MSAREALRRVGSVLVRGMPKGRLARARFVLIRLVVGFVAFTVAQVVYVRFLPPITTHTMEARRWEALLAGKRASIAREWVDRDQVCDDLVRAVLAGEDDVFFKHHGFDWDQIKKAWRHNQKGGKLQGASTLTQQTAKNVFLWQGRSWLRKGLEAWYTVLLELLVPKERILVLYLNVAEWGDLVFGAEAGARRYFHKPASRLTRSEAAALSAVLPNPRKYKADGDSRFKRRRQEVILRRMASIRPDEGPRVDLDEDEEDAAEREERRRPKTKE